MARAGFERNDPELAIPPGALRPGPREAPERLLSASHSAAIVHTPAEPLALQPPRTDGMRKWKLALVASCVFHAAVAMFLIQATDASVQIEGAEYSGAAALGNASEDQTSAGTVSAFDNPVEVTMITMLEARPVETVEAATVPVETAAAAAQTVEPAVIDRETVQPVEETRVSQAEATTTKASPAETVEPVEAEALEAADVVEPAPHAAVTQTAPEVLATDRPLPDGEENFVPAPAVESAEPAEPAEPAKPAEPVKPEPERIEKAEAPAPVARPEPSRKKPAKQEARPKKAEREKVAKPAAAKPDRTGNGGQGQADTVRGQSNGTAGQQASRSKGGKASAAGNAAVSNYPGKVASKLRRALVYPSAAKRQKLRGKVQVSFVVSAGGGVGSIRIVSSSGSPVLDKAALETVRRAAPFPPIPEAAGRSSWPFSVPLAFSR